MLVKAMEIKGKVVKVMEIQTGAGKNGNGWMKQDFVVETGGQFPKKVCMCLWGEEKINQYDLQEGLTVTAHIELESREYNGRWYTDVRAWKVTWDAQARKWEPGGVGKSEPSLSESSRASEHSTSVTDDLPF